MTADEFKSIRTALGLPRGELAAVLGIENPGTVTRWCNGDRAVPGPVATLMRLFVEHPDILNEAKRKRE